MLLTVVLERRRPTVGCLINMVYIGLCIDFFFFLGWVPVFEQVWAQSLMLCIGIGMMGFGSGMYVAARCGAGPRDGLTLALGKKLGWSVRKVRTALELTALFFTRQVVANALETFAGRAERHSFGVVRVQ